MEQPSVQDRIPAERGTTWHGGALISLAAVIVILAGLKAAETIVIQVLLGLFVATICAGGITALERIRVPRSVALAVVLLVLAAVGFAILAMAGSALVELSSQIPGYQARFKDLLARAIESMERMGWNIPDQSLSALVNSTDIFRFVAVLFASLGQAFNHFLILVVLAGFILGESFAFGDKARAAFTNADVALEPLRETIWNVKQFLGIKALVSLILAIGVFVLLRFSPVPNALVWALLAFVLNFIPIFGALMASAPPLVIAVVTSGWVPALWIASGYLVLTSVLFNFVEPLLMGKHLGLSPLVVILSILFWGWLFGPVGMLLGVPIMMALKIALLGHPDTRWLAVLLGSTPPTPQGANPQSATQ